jgi:hypothetical protein
MRIQYRSVPVDRFLTATGLTLEPNRGGHQTPAFQALYQPVGPRDSPECRADG